MSLRDAGDVIERVAQASPALTAARARAREASRTAVEEMQERLRDALAGETIRGLVDLNPSGDRWLGARVHGHGHHGVDSYLPPDGRPALCITAKGVLVHAWIEGAHVKTERTATLDIRAEDISQYARTLVIVLTRHLEATSSAAASYGRTAALADAIRKAIEPSR